MSTNRADELGVIMAIACDIVAPFDQDVLRRLVGAKIVTSGKVPKLTKHGKQFIRTWMVAGEDLLEHGW